MLPREFYEYRNNHAHLDLLDGYLSLLSDEEISKYSSVMSKKISTLKSAVVFATSAFGDLFVWDGTYIYLLRLAESRIDVILSGFTFFYQNIMDIEYQKDMFDLDRFYAVQNEVGEICNGECYIYEPIPIFGGNMSVDTVRIGNREEYIRFLLALQDK